MLEEQGELAQVLVEAREVLELAVLVVFLLVQVVSLLLTLVLVEALPWAAQEWAAALVESVQESARV